MSVSAAATPDADPNQGFLANAGMFPLSTHGVALVFDRDPWGIVGIRIDDTEFSRDARVQQPYALGAQKRQQRTRLLVGYDEFHLYGEGARGFEKTRFVQHMVAAKACHGTKRRPSANPKSVRLREQPLPKGAIVMPIALVHVEPEE
jgi:hypothetical protein